MPIKICRPSAVHGRGLFIGRSATTLTLLLSLALLISWSGWFVGPSPAAVRAAAVIGSQAANIGAPGSLPGRVGYVGDQTCAGCHQSISKSYRSTPHRLTSQIADGSSILGSFHAPQNELRLINSSDELAGLPLTFIMQERSDGFFEIAHEALTTGPHPQLQIQSGRMDVVTGSGMRGQSYLSWRGDKLYELPISYWSSTRQWITSPGYANGSADFARPVYPRCLECHATYIRALSDDPLTNRYDRNSLVPGVSCETCHGPGAAHVILERSLPPGAPQPAHLRILNPAHFSRDRQVDLCALCHDGSRRVEMAPAFSYVPGQPLNDYLRPESSQPPVLPDVHGNKVGLLERSTCFRSSPNMSCSTCHDVHTSGRSLAAYSQRCLSCHRIGSCAMSRRLGSAIVRNCIDCHMPLQQTSAIISQTGSEILRTSMHTHWIRVYPAISARVLRQEFSHASGQ